MTFFLRIDGQPCRIRITSEPEAATRYEFAKDGSDWQLIEADATLMSRGLLSLIRKDGQSMLAQLDSGPLGIAIILDGRRYNVAEDDPRSLAARRNAAEADNGPVTITSPMPGRVVRILQAAGSVVAGRQGVLVIEAMKMQNELKAPRGGNIESLLVSEGDSVVAGQALAVIR